MDKIEKTLREAAGTLRGFYGDSRCGDFAKVLEHALYAAANSLSTQDPPKDKKWVFWPAMPALPSMILSHRRGDKDLIEVETAMAREAALLDYIKETKRVALEVVDAANGVTPHTAEWYKQEAEELRQSANLWKIQCEETRANNRRMEGKIKELRRQVENLSQINDQLENSNDHLIARLRELLDGESSPTS